MLSPVLLQWTIVCIIMYYTLIYTCIIYNYNIYIYNICMCLYMCVYFIVIHIAWAPRVINKWRHNVMSPVDEWHTYYDSVLNQCVVTIWHVIMCMSVCVCLCVSLWCVCVHIYVCLCVCVSVCVYVYTYVYMCVLKSLFVFKN